MKRQSPYDIGLPGLEKLKPAYPEYNRAVLKLGDEIEYFTERLSPEDESRFASLIALYEDVHVMEKRELLAHCSKSSVRVLRK